MKNESQAVLYRSSNVEACVFDDAGSDTEIENFYNIRFGVDDVRELIQRAYHRPQEKKSQLLVVRTEFVTHEAQNALLKLFEEPPESTRLALVVPPDFVLLPTLNSRLQEIVVPDQNLPVEKIFHDFLKSDYKERIKSIEQGIKKKDVVWQRVIKTGLVSYLKNESFELDSAESLEYVARMLLTRGASNKMLLEHLALSLPVSSP